MSLFAAMRKLWHAIAPRTSSDVEEEFRSTLDAYKEDLMRQGFPENEARRKARIDLGRPAAQNETYRRAIGLRLFDELGGDIRYGLRGLRRNPAFATVAVLSLALGIGATTAMVSLIYAVLLHPFPYAGSDRIMNPVIVDQQQPEGDRWFAIGKAQFDELHLAAPVESALGFNFTHMEITGGGLPEDIEGIYVTENAGSFFGMHPLLGRNIAPSDAENGGHLVIVLNYRFWQRHFGGDPRVVGRTVEIDHAAYTIVGVMPRTFAFNDTITVGDVYLPGNLMQRLPNIPYWLYIPWIKLRPHVTLAAANAAIEPIVREFAKEHPERFPHHWHLALQPIIVPFQQRTGRTLTLLLAGVVLLLIIGCANCSILLLARGRTRRHELAIRSAIGASRWRIVRQLLMEAIVISCTGAILGVAASYWLAKLPMLLSPDSFPAESIIRINGPILAFSVALAVLCGILFGLAPALRFSHGDSARMLPGRQTGVVAAPGKCRWSVLIAAQVALTLLLMATAGTAIHSFLTVMKTPLGYDPANIMKVGIMLATQTPDEWNRFQSREGRTAYIEQIREKIASIPGVSMVAVAADATPPYSGADNSFEMDGTGDHEQPQARVMLVDQRYFAALRIRVLQGRIWNAEENNRGDFIAVVNHAFAARYLGASSVLGRQIRIPGLTPKNRYQVASVQSTGWRQIIGVIGDARNDGVDRPVVPAIYLPYTTVMQPYAQFFVRTQNDPLTYLRSIRAAIASVASDQQISTGGFNPTFTLNEAIERDAQYSSQRLFSILFSVFSAMALALALVGIFSLVAYSVAQRTTEFGVRLALGAPRKHVLWVATRMALISAAAGIAIGLAIAPPALQFKNGTVPAPIDRTDQSYRQWFRDRGVTLGRAKAFYVPPTAPRTIHFTAPTACSQEAVQAFADALCGQLSQWTGFRFAASLCSQYRSLEEGIANLERSAGSGMVVFVFEDDDPAAYFEIEYGLKSWRVKRLRVATLMRHFDAAKTHLTSPTTNGNGNGRGPLPKQLWRWTNFVKICALDVFQKLGALPWRVEPTSQIDAELSIDVGADRRHFSVSLLVNRDVAGKAEFSLETLTEWKADYKHEAINPEALKPSVIRVFRSAPISSPLQTIAVYRDGNESAQERNALEEAFAMLKIEGRLHANARVIYLSVRKSGIKNIRLWELDSNGRAVNTLEGTALRLQPGTVILCTTGGACLTQGSADPLLLATSGGSSTDLDDAVIHFFHSAQLNYSSPTVAQRLSAGLKRTDEELRARAAQEIRRIK